MFLQAKEWEKILNSEGKKTERITLPNSEEIFFIYQKAGFFEYVFCPGGPKSLTAEGIQFLTGWLLKRRIIFFRFEPNVKLETNKFKIKKTFDVTPSTTNLLDLTKSEEILFAAMHEKTRYNIRLAEKKNLNFETGKDWEAFWNLMQQTAARDKFRTHSREHYKTILNSDFSRQLTLFTDDGTPVATGVWVGFGKTFTYLFGASDYTFRSLMAPYRLQWEAIKLGKKLGFSIYDFFGIAPNSRKPESHKATQYVSYDYDSKHQYAGVTRFKLGFGGNICEKPGTFDLIFSSLKYRVYQIVRVIRRFI